MVKRFRVLVFCAWLLFVFAPFSFAGDSERISRLEREVAELKRIVNQLAAENQELKAGVEDVSKEVSASAAAFSDEETVPGSPKLNIHGFGHVQYDYSRADHADGTRNDTNHFTLGGVDLFITSQISDKISFLNETLFEFGTDGSNVLDVERVLLKYEAADWFKISGGRGHTALGYWNQRFHHGTWLQTTADRPAIYRFEDDGGVLPIHFVGLELSGDIKQSAGTWSYIGNIVNGRGKTPDEIHLVEDDNDSKQFGLMVSYKPDAVDGLGFGANVSYDIIPSNIGTTNRGSEIDELIYGGHIYYTADPYEVILETQVIDHFNHDTRLADTTMGGYLQMAYQMEKYKPYFRFDWLRIADRDPFFGGTIPDETSSTLGLRYDLTTYADLKFEYRHIDTDAEKRNEVHLQSSFAF